MGQRRNYGDHNIEWLDGANAIVIRPRYPNASMLDFFGLGNAIISFNLLNPPEQIVKRITGETTGQGLLPTSPFKLKRWYGMPENMDMRTEILTGYDGWSEEIEFPQANGGSVKEVASVPILQNGYGCEEIANRDRVNW